MLVSSDKPFALFRPGGFLKALEDEACRAWSGTAIDSGSCAVTPDNMASAGPWSLFRICSQGCIASRVWGDVPSEVSKTEGTEGGDVSRWRRLAGDAAESTTWSEALFGV